MEWGYGWGAGPLRTLDLLGVAATVERAKAEGRAIPNAIETLLASGRERFFEDADAQPARDQGAHDEHASGRSGLRVRCPRQGL